MEQRRGPNIQPVLAAATDPAYVPGITPPRLAADPDETVSPADTAPETEPRDAVADVAEENAAATADDEDSGTADAADTHGADAPEAPEAADSGEFDGSDDTGEPAEPDAPAASGEGDADSAADAGSGDGGPVFEASDRRGSITADRSGVRLRLDDQECEFRWDEIGAVEIETSRFGRWFTVTVHTPDRRWYPADIEVKDKTRIKEWTDQLDAVLDAYFDDEAEPKPDPEPEAEAEAEADVEADDEAKAKA
ncbi:prolipoprotein diacylglyceryl transferase [Streptomyces jeddahensis]|uniref:Uncharacterized protein n=1 Tax=Streptomyces jeddahensis TaxID=1716141 RepID=A0A177HSX3_9ACTN|nr:hypothetical protein [Streptomyces jeddahensis]OAH13826.1 hypothetical protein STSP_28040 [Streptomyces jeddahensis]